MVMEGTVLQTKYRSGFINYRVLKFHLIYKTDSSRLQKQSRNTVKSKLPSDLSRLQINYARV